MLPLLSPDGSSHSRPEIHSLPFDPVRLRSGQATQYDNGILPSTTRLPRFARNDKLGELTPESAGFSAYAEDRELTGKTPVPLGEMIKR